MCPKEEVKLSSKELNTHTSTYNPLDEHAERPERQERRVELSQSWVSPASQIGAGHFTLAMKCRSLGSKLAVSQK